MSLTDDGQSGRSESTAASADAMPAGLTRAGCEAFRDVEEEFRDGLTAQLRRRRRSRRDLTSDDVYEALAIVTHEMCQAHQRAGSLRALGPGLIAIGSVGVGSMHPYLHSSWQIALLVVFGVLGLAGVGLVWRSGQPVDTSGESAG